MNDIRIIKEIKKTMTINESNTLFYKLYTMQLVFKVPKLVKTQHGNDLCFSQVAFHSDSWKRLRTLKIDQELLDKIKRLPYPRQLMEDGFIEDKEEEKKELSISLIKAALDKVDSPTLQSIFKTVFVYSIIDNKVIIWVYEKGKMILLRLPRNIQIVEKCISNEVWYPVLVEYVYYDPSAKVQ